MHDVFVSYARVDDESPTGSGHGWVTTFEHWLCEALERPLGRRPDTWMDWQLAANAPLTATLLDEVRNSRSLVLILSLGYQNSPWCEFELNNFLGQHPPVGGREAILVVEIYPVDRHRLPARVQELVPVQFWEAGIDDRIPRTLGWPTVDPDEHNPYWAKLNFLAYQIAAQISVPITRVLEPPPSAAPVVWIADPTPKVVEYQDELAVAITRNGGTIGPKARVRRSRTSGPQRERGPPACRAGCGETEETPALADRIAGVAGRSGRSAVRHGVVTLARATDHQAGDDRPARTRRPGDGQWSARQQPGSRPSRSVGRLSCEALQAGDRAGAGPRHQNPRRGSAAPAHGFGRSRDRAVR
ncbi:toll/interleukin-1 receptor domain-containing protein [Accumulibacter sp.]|uniref:toll/interleukin-1 receptor domain-containing protein n=1 Tax=Accumulibacter sp. TaxID=2053492 RepID=UPI0025E48C4D|nr:toll/interleukin-1 receptor domain-containing protein [Accumulibacter sp.]MCM8627507.1 toll/interleukin-1 receptor domain-containing protein [Accumulibacter sp.]